MSARRCFPTRGGGGEGVWVPCVSQLPPWTAAPRAAAGNPVLTLIENHNNIPREMMVLEESTTTKGALRCLLCLFF